MSYTYTILIIFSLLSVIKCSSENCDKYGTLFYEDIGCKAIKSNENDTCPTKYDCNLTKVKSGCQFKGEIYPANKEIPIHLTYSACMAACICNGLNITCASVDCPEFFLPQLNPDCYAEYELDQCCLKSIRCKNSTNHSRKSCNVNGKLYRLGEQFQPKDTCLACVCHENYTGKLDNQTCSRINCATELFEHSKIRQNCAPTYLKLFQYDEDILCCPNHWICPNATQELTITNDTMLKNISINDTNDLECYFAEKTLKYGQGFNETVNKYDKIRQVRCECILPPLLTCKEID